ncbi:MAG: hypothetical protein MK289_03595 [Trichodesmium sp. ALOHA_ZT_67]|uniref:hypothetical protein n=1 Tax=Trichodesmium erythraeum TaxID=1206 RepID=UPI0003266DF4|nr:hypothetical protein [Trichodesmium erythraeum GBRTRLIN201]MCH2047596.1 hypothetical protein [Trichodesmium sp. ALOHA_ZT_67]MDT9341275.1 hypothetical protein [Trichodesmium erythraeum 21-75]
MSTVAISPDRSLSITSIGLAYSSFNVARLQQGFGYGDVVHQFEKGCIKEE